MRSLVFVIAIAFLFVACSPTTQQDVQQQSVPDVDVQPAADVQPSPAVAEPTQVIRGTRNYIMTVDRIGFTPSVLTVPQDYRIKITLTNEDADEHSFDLIEYGISENIPSKRTAVIDFVSDSKGEFTFDDRFGSSGTLIVGGKT